ncbi:MAG TPA: dsDNA nuclease domain-containing protein [Devosia sp.]|nr:dsDNA nuclease domain-containing protein [Devosia sp.]
MGVKQTLLAVSQREEGGRTAYDRFDYQTAWGVSKLLDLHDAGKNYAVAFEFHDDIISLDDADAPAKAIFYQVKTKKSGNWSFAQITSRPSNKGGEPKGSFAGKMFDNFIRFGAVVEKLVFVSNQPLPDIIVVHGERDFSAAEKTKLEKFVTSLAAEASGFKDPEHTSLFFFAFSDLNLSNYENAVLGRISDFLEQELGGHIPAKPFALMLNDYCRRRSKALADFSSFEELKASKFVTRGDMSKWLSQIRDQHERRPEWGSIAGDLSLPFAEKTKIERAWREYEVALRARQNAATIAMTERLRTPIDAAIEQVDDLVALIDAVFAEAKPVVRAWKSDASDHFVKAAILYEFKR